MERFDYRKYLTEGWLFKERKQEDANVAKLKKIIARFDIENKGDIEIIEPSPLAGCTLDVQGGVLLYPGEGYDKAKDVLHDPELVTTVLQSIESNQYRTKGGAAYDSFEEGLFKESNLRPELKSELFDILTVQLGIDDKKLVAQILKSCNMERANRFVERIKGSFGLK